MQQGKTPAIIFSLPGNTSQLITMDSQQAANMVFVVLLHEYSRSVRVGLAIA